MSDLKSTVDIASFADASITKLQSDSRLGADLDMVPSDRRDRARILPNFEIAEKQVVTTTEGQTVVVLGPGRGSNTFLAAWQEELVPGVVVNCMGTFFEDQIKRLEPVEAEVKLAEVVEAEEIRTTK